MTTFQTVVYAVVHGVSDFLPLSSQAHHALVGYLLGWQVPSGALMTAFLVGSALALFIYFLHDWASMISSVLQVVIYRRKPMTMDERIPLFVGLTTLPAIAASFYFGPTLRALEWTPFQLCAVLAGTAIPVWFFDYWARKVKSFYDWNVLDALVVGVFQATALIPGWDRLSSLLLGAFILNYKREPALKYAYFALFPLLLARAVLGLHELDFHAAAPMTDLTWLSFFVGLVVTFLVGLLVIGYAMRQVQQWGVSRPMYWRVIVSLGVCCYLWFKAVP